MKLRLHFPAISSRRATEHALIRTYPFTHVLIYPLTLLLLSCSEPPSTPPPYVRTVFLSEEYAGVTHASLRLTFYDTTGSREFALRRDGTLIMEGVMHAGDTVLVDTALLPARTYTYRAYRLRDAAVRDSSALLQVTTMDTTSHDFTWEITYLGDGQSYLKDVFAISDTDVWAVGQIYLRDSTGGLNKKYNVIHYNGREWQLIQTNRNPWIPSPSYSVFGFSRDDIWIGGTIPIHWDGKKWKHFGSQQGFPVFGPINKIWGRSSSDLYFVGTNGSITHYDGQKFEREESGTSYDLTDVFGTEHEVWAVGGSPFRDQGIVLFESNGIFRQIDSLSNNNMWSVASVWCDDGGFSGNGLFAFAGRGIQYKNPVWQVAPTSLTGGNLGLGDLFFSSIRGSKSNNILSAGDFGIVLHYNGKSWIMYQKLFRFPSNRIFASLSVKDQYVFIVGVEDGRGLIYKGIKSN